jgi:hypothetical protein
MDLPLGRATVAGLAADESAAERIVAALTAAGIDAPCLSLCAQDAARARTLAARLGVSSDRTAEDPLAGAPGLEGPVAQRARADRGALFGALVGVLAGVGLGLSPVGQLAHVAPEFSTVVDALFFFVVGIIGGAVLGTAIGPRLSTHVGYRLIDGMQEGSIAIIASCASAQAPAASTAMTESNAVDVIVVD